MLIFKSYSYLKNFNYYESSKHFGCEKVVKSCNIPVGSNETARTFATFHNFSLIIFLHEVDCL